MRSYKSCMLRSWAIVYFAVFLALSATSASSADIEARFIDAIKKEDFDTLAILVQEVDNIDIRVEDGRTALMLASKHGQAELVKLLIESGADVNARNANGGSPLMYASIKADLETISRLLENGADVNMRAKFNWTALMVAAAKGHTKIIKILLDFGADANSRDVYQWTPLMRASFAGYDKAVSEMLKYPQTKINAIDENGATALHHAATNGHKEVVRLLLQNNASTTIYDKFNLKAQGRAEIKKHTDIIELFLAHSNST